MKYLSDKQMQEILAEIDVEKFIESTFSSDGSISMAEFIKQIYSIIVKNKKMPVIAKIVFEKESANFIESAKAFKVIYDNFMAVKDVLMEDACESISKEG
jgi:hypothetical protein